MINLVIWVPLALSGLVGALYREHKYKKRQEILLADDLFNPSKKRSTSMIEGGEQQPVMVDDAVELTHYKRSSFMGLALTSSFALFYSPFLLATIPLLTYNTFYLLRSIQRTSKTNKTISAVHIFEITNLILTLLSRYYVWSSFLLVLSFNIRTLRLKVLNAANIGFKEILNAKSYNVWVLREQIEVEIPFTDLQKYDVLAIHEGEIIPIEGIIVDGLAKVEQYSIIGTLQTVTKQTDDVVFAFTRIETGQLHIRYT
ncbi:MAG: hypothetical protein Q9M50_08610 [Methylococcales bacterium]|nr:hypothetical protein [Methylococcales bacterium]